MFKWFCFFVFNILPCFWEWKSKLGHNSGIPYTPYIFRVRIRVRIRVRVRIRIRVRVRVRVRVRIRVRD